MSQFKIIYKVTLKHVFLDQSFLRSVSSILSLFTSEETEEKQKQATSDKTLNMKQVFHFLFCGFSNWVSFLDQDPSWYLERGKIKGNMNMSATSSKCPPASKQSKAELMTCKRKQRGRRKQTFLMNRWDRKPWHILRAEVKTENDKKFKLGNYNITLEE